MSTIRYILQKETAMSIILTTSHCVMGKSEASAVNNGSRNFAWYLPTTRRGKIQPVTPTKCAASSKVEIPMHLSSTVGHLKVEAHCTIHFKTLAPGRKAWSASGGISKGAKHGSAGISQEEICWARKRAHLLTMVDDQGSRWDAGFLLRLQRLLRSLRPLGAEWSSSILVCHSLLIQRLFKDSELGAKPWTFTGCVSKSSFVKISRCSFRICCGDSLVKFEC